MMDSSEIATRDACRGKKSFSGKIIMILLGFLAVVVAFPFYNVLIVSFADQVVVSKQLFYILPVSFDFSSYKFIFESSTIVNSCMVSVFITVVGTSLSMMVSTAGAYALSKKDYPGRNIIMKAIIFSMFFSGGIVPFYLTVKSFGLIDKIFSLILPSLVNTFYLIILINFFRTVPASLEESARIDGANDMLILFRIVLPVSTPTIAAISLFYAVDQWNAFYYALLFITDQKKYPLQIMLREILVNYTQMINSPTAISMMRQKPIFQESLKMAVVVITAIPIILVYPFLQKHFTKGIMVGSLKG
jgi:ABC-type sugar transport system, permease component